MIRRIGQGVLDIAAALVLVAVAVLFIAAVSSITGALVYVVSLNNTVQAVLSVAIVVGIGVYWWGKVF